MRLMATSLILLLTLTLYPSYNFASSWCTTGDTANCSEGFCSCMLNLSRATLKKPIDVGSVNGKAGSDNPVEVFRGGGSENIPVICRAAKYLTENDPKWFIKYFDLFITGEEGVWGREIFGGYVSATFGVWAVVRTHAIEKNHAELIEKSTKVIKAFYAILALSATTTPTRQYAVHQRDQAKGIDVFKTENASHIGGYSVGLPANRAYVNTYPSGNNFQDTYLSMALSHPSRTFTWSLDQNQGYGGLCMLVKSVGGPIGKDGKVNLKSFDPSPEKFGLTQDEKSKLQAFINSNGKDHLDFVLSLLKPFKLNCPLTILRTTKGVTTYFGYDDEKVGLCSRAKGGTFVATTYDTSTSTLTSLSRATLQNFPEAATVWVENNQVCEKTDTLPTKCIPIIGGQLISKVIWGKRQVEKVYPPDPTPTATPIHSGTPGATPPPKKTGCGKLFSF